MTVSTTYYNTDNLIAGSIQSQQVKFAEDTYWRGMPLEYDAANDRYCYYGTDTNILHGFFLEDDGGVGVAKADNEWGSIIRGGEIHESGIVDDSGNAMTITEDMIAGAAILGFYIKRK
jgi:hypothetical protein